jgi:hypothetical protein
MDSINKNPRHHIASHFFLLPKTCRNIAAHFFLLPKTRRNITAHFFLLPKTCRNFAAPFFLLLIQLRYSLIIFHSLNKN